MNRLMGLRLLALLTLGCIAFAAVVAARAEAPAATDLRGETTEGRPIHLRLGSGGEPESFDVEVGVTCQEPGGPMVADWFALVGATATTERIATAHRIRERRRGSLSDGTLNDREWTMTVTATDDRVWGEVSYTSTVTLGGRLTNRCYGGPARFSLLRR